MSQISSQTMQLISTLAIRLLMKRLGVRELVITPEEMEGLPKEFIFVNLIKRKDVDVLDVHIKLLTETETALLISDYAGNG